MKNTLRLFTALAPAFIAAAAVAQPPSVDATPADARPSALNSEPSTLKPSVGDRLLAQAASQLERRRSVTARLRHQVMIGGQQLYGVGSYWQQGTGDEIRVRLELQIAGQATSLLQISNSRFLWFDRLLPTGRTVTRIDLRQLRADPVLAASNNFNELRPGEASWSTTQSDVTAQCGGLPRLLAALGENFSFLPPQAMRLVEPNRAEPTNVPFFAVVGHWKYEKLVSLVGDPGLAHFAESAQQNVPDPLLYRQQSSERSSNIQHPASSIQHIPARLPQEVLLLIGQADLFPYRIEYRGLETPLEPQANGSPVAYQLSSCPLVVLEFANVAFDVPIAASQFDYAPRDVEWVDHTAVMLERLRRERQAKVAAQTNAPRDALPTR
jgi:hypothetical protein